MDHQSRSNKYISLHDILKYVRDFYYLFKQHFFKIAIGAVVCGVLGIAYAYVKKPNYKAYLSFILNENESASINLSSIAGLAGLGAGEIKGGVNEEKLLFLAGSRFIIGTTLLNPVNINGRDQLLGNYFIDAYGLQKGFASDSVLKGFTYFHHTSLDSLTLQENKALDKILKIFSNNQLLKITGKKKTGLVSQNSGIITVDFVSKSEIFSHAFVEQLFSNISKYYINKSIQRQERNYFLIKHRADSLRGILFSTEISGADYLDQNVNIAKMAARVKLERTRRDVELLNLMYAEVLKNLEIAKFNLENQTPMLQLIDRPTFPLEVQKESKIIMGILGGIVGGALTFISILLFQFFRTSFAKLKEE